jgi:hypothetical protein
MAAEPQGAQLVPDNVVRLRTGFKRGHGDRVPPAEGLGADAFHELTGLDASWCGGPSMLAFVLGLVLVQCALLALAAIGAYTLAGWLA